ncbi:MAG: TonB-dependent receptor [Ignavibacteriales bacterium]|nr:MAG: TonB-dependent receptor [Ignavibacteriales bacterium]
MKIFKIICLIYLCTVSIIYAQNFSLSGKVTDINLNPISGVNVILRERSTGTHTDSSGNFSFSHLPAGSYNLEFSIVGYKKEIRNNIVISNQSLTIQVELEEAIIQSESVVITAGKHEQKISELPVSTVVLSNREVNNRNFISLDEAMRHVPGVSVNLDQISIRGSSGYSRGAGTRVLVAQDGIPLYTGDTGEIIWEIIPVTEFERIEIIKGAASSLYGSTAIGGVINIITREITDKPITYFKSYIGAYDKPSYKEWDWSGEYRSFNGLTLTHSQKVGKLGFTLSGTRTEDLSYRQSGFVKRYTGYLKSTYNIDSLNTFTLLANGLTQNRGNFIYWKSTRGALQPRDIDQGQRVYSDRYMLGVMYNKIFSNDFSLNTKVSYYNTHWRDETESSDDSRAGLGRAEIQSTYNFNKNLFWINGVEASYGKVKSNIFSHHSSSGFGFYSHIDLKFDFPLLFSAGARFDYSKLDSIDSFSSFSPKIGLNYKLYETTIIRASAGKGFRAPTLAEAYTKTSASGVVIKPNPSLIPEYNYSFEIGINQVCLHNLILDVSVFQNEFYDFIEPGIDLTDGQVFFDNVTRARIQGLETTLNYILFNSSLKLNLNHTYLWARDVEKKKMLKYRPRHTFYASALYTLASFEIESNFRFWSRVEEIDNEIIDLGVVIDGDKRVPVYVWDARIGYTFIINYLPFKLNLNANNLLNYNYVEMIGNLSPIRNISLSLEVTF